MNPTKQQWQKVIDNFERVLPMATMENHLTMQCTSVNENGYKCGTVHCVGGWYAVATLNMNNGEKYSYSDGADKMAQDLGFEYDYQLLSWSIKNFEIWGNKSGNEMFCSPLAYNGADSLAEVVEFLKGVRDRSPEEEVANG